jgi:hypothetical protein
MASTSVLPRRTAHRRRRSGRSSACCTACTSASACRPFHPDHSSLSRPSRPSRTTGAWHHAPAALLFACRPLPVCLRLPRARAIKFVRAFLRVVAVRVVAAAALTEASISSIRTATTNPRRSALRSVPARYPSAFTTARRACPALPPNLHRHDGPCSLCTRVLAHSRSTAQKWRAPASCGRSVSLSRRRMSGSWAIGRCVFCVLKRGRGGLIVSRCRDIWLRRWNECGWAALWRLSKLTFERD